MSFPPLANVGRIPAAILIAALAVSPARAQDAAADAAKLLADGSAPQALAACNAALAKDPKNVPLLMVAAETSTALDQPARAVTFLERAFLVAPKDRCVTHNLSLALFQTNAQPRAIKIVKDYLAANPKPLDEPLLNQLLYLLDAANAATKKTKIHADATAFAQQYTTLLEAERPGDKRVGAGWQSAAGGASPERQAALDAVADFDAQIARDNRGRNSLKAKAADLEAKIAAGEADASELQAVQDHIGRVERAIARKTRDRDKIVVPPAAETAAIAPAEPKWLAYGTPAPAIAPVEPTVVAAVPEPSETPRTPMAEAPPAAETPAEPAREAMAEVVENETVEGIAVAVAEDLLLTAASNVTAASEINVTSSQGDTDTAVVIKSDPEAGLALLQLKSIKAFPLTVARNFAGGDVQCLTVKAAGLFHGETVAVDGKAAAPAAKWAVSLAEMPRRGGAPLVSGRQLVGLTLLTPDVDFKAVPTVPADAIVKFVADAGKQGRRAADPKQAVFQISVVRPSR